MRLTQPSITDILKKHELYTPDSKKAKDITAKIMECICIDHQPLSVTEDIGFKRLIAHLEPLYKLPRRKYFTDVALLVRARASRAGNPGSRPARCDGADPGGGLTIIV